MRGGRVAVVAVLTAAVLSGGVATLAVRGEEPARPVLPSPVPQPSRLPVLALPAPDPAAPTTTGVARALALAIRDRSLGPAVAVSVLDALTGAVVYETRADTLVTPASTSKILTAVAALIALPSDQRLETRVVAGAAPGEVVLIGGGDASLAGRLDRPAYPRRARLADLAAAVRASRGTEPLTRVVVDDSLYAGPLLGPGWRPQYVTGGAVAPVTALMVDGARTRPAPSSAPRLPDPSLAAGRQLAVLLGAPKAPVVRGQAAEGAVRLGSVLSPPVPQLVEAMLVSSDNDLAEALARQVALARGQPATFGGAAAALAEVLRDSLVAAGVGPASVRVLDGSGLSRLSRLQPGALTRLLAAVAADDTGRFSPVLSGLPVAGFDGTLADRYRGGPGRPAAGAVRAKTGTLNGVSALAGLVRTRDGRLLSFALTADAVALGATRASQLALDRLAAVLAACGCR